MLAAIGTPARAAQNDIDFKTADIDHVSNSGYELAAFRRLL